MKYTTCLEVILKELNLSIPPFIMTRRYGPLSGPTSSSCGGLRPLAEAFFAKAFREKRVYYSVLALKSSPVFPVSEYRGGPPSGMDGQMKSGNNCV